MKGDENMPGITTESTYDPGEIRSSGALDQFKCDPVTIESGRSLAAGTVIGIAPTVSGKYAAYDNDGNASATTPEAGASNVGTGTMSAVTVDDDHTITENFTLTCTAEAGNAGTFSVVGSVSGDLGDATVGTPFVHDKVSFTISDGGEDFDIDDVFTFSTVRAEPLAAKGILREAVDATSQDVVSSAYSKGNFVYSKLTGIDAAAIADLNGVYDSTRDELRIN